MTKSDDEIKVINLARELVSIINDESLPDETADREVGRILFLMDQLISKMDGLPTYNKISKTDHIKMEIDPPRKADKKGK